MKDRQPYLCKSCNKSFNTGKRQRHKHHIVPSCVADKMEYNDPENIIALCPRCHSRLHHMYIEIAFTQVHEQFPDFFHYCLETLPNFQTAPELKKIMALQKIEEAELEKIDSCISKRR